MNKKVAKKIQAMLPEGMNMQDYITLKNKIAQTASKNSIEIIMGAVLLALHDKFSFGEHRLNRLINETNETLENINTEIITPEDLRNMVQSFKFNHQQLYKDML
jgi:hypothetical protein